MQAQSRSPGLEGSTNKKRLPKGFLVCWAMAPVHQLIETALQQRCRKLPKKALRKCQESVNIRFIWRYNMLIWCCVCVICILFGFLWANLEMNNIWIMNSWCWYLVCVYVYDVFAQYCDRKKYHLSNLSCWFLQRLSGSRCLTVSFFQWIHRRLKMMLR